MKDLITLKIMSKMAAAEFAETGETKIEFTFDHHFVDVPRGDSVTVTLTRNTQPIKVNAQDIFYTVPY